ncbi:hypothetical protein [Caulobacter phage Cr30]|uniref:hypothetical protein n=1 Tax=Caulobacter phage Cr30 TaxID=1357714 RepID=UPI0004A9B637|nr:hypothetical protein OZ74_gp141 [Caulobacter phage Cr30]AGS81026.1 hypothetical protein [Caulobacter phage Cr30]
MVDSSKGDYRKMKKHVQRFTGWYAASDFRDLLISKDLNPSEIWEDESENGGCFFTVTWYEE